MGLLERFTGKISYRITQEKFQYQRVQILMNFRAYTLYQKSLGIQPFIKGTGTYIGIRHSFLLLVTAVKGIGPKRSPLVGT